MSFVSNLVFVDCEAKGPCPSMGRLAEFGAVTLPAEQGSLFFHGVLEAPWGPWAQFRAPTAAGSSPFFHDSDVFYGFRDWLAACICGRPIFVSDNPAYDWQWINDGFHRHVGSNPFGHSARRISDFYAGLTGNFHNTQWKQLRITPHDHHPVHDARGNAEAFARMLAGER